jgi:adenosylhomocysteine nucleosidase
VFGFVVGLAAEARIAARFGYLVRAGGGTPRGAEAAATRLIAEGATALVSFGLAGGLDPALRPGAVIIPSTVLSDGRSWSADAVLAQRFGGLTGHAILAGSSVAADAVEKRNLRMASAAHAIDLESGAVATTADKFGLPFIVVRAICDPAERNLPPAAMIALNPDGGIGFWGVLRSVFAKPSQIPGLLALARDAARARRSLVRLAERSQAEVRRSSR